MLAPFTARAACDLPEADIAAGANAGIPQDASVVVDPGRVRHKLGQAGIAIGGVYYAEAFQNWGGIKDGGAYDGVLELYVNADMNKLGLWRGLCFFANGYQIHGRSITAEYVGSLKPVSSLVV